MREILLKVEGDKKATGPAWINLSIEGRDPVEVWHHVQLLDEAGLLEAKNLPTLNEYEWQPIRLTWAGAGRPAGAPVGRVGPAVGRRSQKLRP